MREIELNKEHICEWPDGSLRKVVVTSVTEGKAKIIWNEKHEPIPGRCGRVIGMDAEVPVEWLYLSNRDTK